MPVMDVSIQLFIPYTFILAVVGLGCGDGSFEASFQGQCNNALVPCEHICRNHSPRTFECFCRGGYQLDQNGYSCTVTMPMPSDTRPTNASENARLPQLLADQPNEQPHPASLSKSNIDHSKLPDSVDCSALPCFGGGICVFRSGRSHGYRCLCPLGHKGRQCQEKVIFTTPQFSGDSYALLPLFADWAVSFHLELQVYAENENGLVLYLGEDLLASRDFLALELIDGYVTFRVHIAVSRITLQSRYKVPFGDLLIVKVGRMKADFYLKVASEDHMITSVQEIDSTVLKATENIYLGGLPDYENIMSGKLSAQSGFVGCVVSLSVNGKTVSLEPLPLGNIIHGINLDKCNTGSCGNINCLNDGQCVVDRRGSAKCECPLTFTGTRCDIDLQLEMPFFNGSSYLLFPMNPSTIAHVTNFALTFRPSNVVEGVLIHIGPSSTNQLFSDALELRFNSGCLELILDLGDDKSVTRIPTKLEANKEWYQVVFRRTGRYAEISLDDAARTHLNYAGHFTELNFADDHLYVGGMDYTDMTYSARQSQYQGCIDLNKSEFMGRKLLLSRALSGANLDSCRSP